MIKSRPAGVAGQTSGGHWRNLVVVLAAGTSDLPVAKEAQLTARYLGRPTELVVDVGVAGLHRVLSRRTCCNKPGSSSWLREWTALCRAWWPVGGSTRGRRTDFGGLRRCVRWISRFTNDAQRLRAWCRGGQHRQRLWRRPPGSPDRGAPITKSTMSSTRHAWIDASAGVAGDMLLGALIDAGADLEAVQQAVNAVIGESVRLSCSPVTRAGQHANLLSVQVITEDAPARSWRTVEDLIGTADLPAPVRKRALASFGRLAEAEGRVHHLPLDEVHFHEVGALDSIADIVGAAAAVHSLKIDGISASAVAVGSGRVRGTHGDMGVPVPAVVELAAG